MRLYLLVVINQGVGVEGGGYMLCLDCLCSTNLPSVMLSLVILGGVLGPADKNLC